MYNLPYDLKLNICCYMDPNSLLNSYCICKSNLINKTDNWGWRFVSTFHLKEFEDINNFYEYRNIFNIRKYGISYILETNLKSYIKESKWAMSWLELDDLFIDFCIKGRQCPTLGKTQCHIPLVARCARLMMKPFLLSEQSFE